MSPGTRAVEMLLEQCPELGQVYEEYFRVERDNPYVLFGLVADRILEVAKSDAPVDRDQLGRLMGVLENLARSGDAWSSDLVQVGVLEELICDEQWQKLKHVMGAATRRLAEELEHP